MKFRVGMYVVVLVGFGVFVVCSKYGVDVLVELYNVCVIGYNEYGCKFYEFWFDNEYKLGCFGNLLVCEDGEVFGGGGGFVCGCKVMLGQKVKLFWEFVQLLDDIQCGILFECKMIDVIILQLELLMLCYLCVYFCKNGMVELQWVDDMNVFEFKLMQEK